MMRSNSRRLPRSGHARRAIVLAILALLAACRSGEPERGRVLLIGIDGATLKIAGPMLQEGRLPHLAALARDGISGPLRSEQPLLSPRIWNTIVTGKSTEKHGIDAFAHAGDDGVPQLLLSTDRRTHALWNIASNAGFSVGVINFWNTFPPEKINGVMVSDHLLPKEVERRLVVAKASSSPVGPVVYPASWQPRVSKLAAAKEPLTSIENPFASLDGFPKWLSLGGNGLREQYENDAAMVRIAGEIERELHPQIQLILLTGIDRVSHFLWGAVEEDVEIYPERLRMRGAEREVAAQGLRRYYEYTDALIGVLLESYGPADLVMVLSDHGQEGGVGFGGLLTGTHWSKKAIDGVIFVRGPGIPAGETVKDMSIRDVTPTILAWLGLPLAADMDGRPAPFLTPVRTQPEPIASYDTVEIERVHSSPSGAEEQIVEQLRELGYIE